MAASQKGCAGDPLTIVCFELDQHDTGVTCGASNPCLVTWNTIENRCDYVCTVNEYYYSTCRIPTHFGIPNYIPALKPVSHLPTKLEIGESFSRRGTIKVCLKATPGCNGEVSPIQQLFAAQKYFTGRTVRVYNGDCSMTLCQMNVERYVIDSVDAYPSGRDCEICVTLKDPLNLVTGAVAPDQSGKILASGEVAPLKLAIALDGVPDDSNPNADPNAQVGSFLLSADYLAGDLDQDRCITQARYLCVDGEVVKVKPILRPSGWNFELVARAQCGTVVGPHDAGKTITIPAVFRDMHVVDVICRLLQDYAKFEDVTVSCCIAGEPRIIDFSTFEAVRCKNPLFIIGERVICKPTKVTALLNELAKTFMLSLYYSGKCDSIKLASVCPDIAPVETLDQCQIVKDSTNTASRKDHYTHVVYNHTLSDCTKSPTLENMLVSTAIVSADAGRDTCDRREYPNDSFLEIDTAWINDSNEYLARTMTRRWLRLRKCAPVQLCVDVMTTTARCFDLADVIEITHPKYVDWQGNPTQWIVTSKKIQGSGECMQLCLESSPWTDADVPCFSCDFDIPEDNGPCDVECLGVW